MTKYYVDAQGKYLGGFDGANPPANAVEVANPPPHGSCVWNGTIWSTYTQPDLSDIENVQKHIKAAVLAAAIMSGKTALQAKVAFKTAWDSLP